MTRPWDWLTIADVLIRQPNKKIVQQGWSPKCHDHPAPDGAWGVLKTTAIQPGRFEPEHNKSLPSALEPKPAIEVREGDLLLTCAGPRSRCGIPALVRSTPRRLMMSGKMYRFRPDDRLDSKFLELWLLSPVAQKLIEPMKTGISDSGLNLTHGRFATLPVPVPEIDEQRRIVAILEDHLSRLDVAEQSVRQAQRRARSMVTSSLAQVVGSAVQEAPMTTVGAHAVIVEYGTSAKCHGEPEADDVPVLRMGNVKNGEVLWSGLKYLPAAHRDFPRLLLRSGDLLFNRTNSTEHVGKAAVFYGGRDASFASYLIRVRFDDAIDPRWANMAINSPQGRAYVASVVSQQVGQANVNGTKLKAFPIPLPSIERQRQLVAVHAEALSMAARVSSAADDAMRRANSLRRSLLTAAFSGRLTGTDTKSPTLKELMPA